MNDVFKALSDPTRREVLRLLKSGPRSAGDLADAFPVSRPTMSAHFNVLRGAGLVSTEKVGKSVIYHLNVSVLEEALLGFAGAFGLGAGVPPVSPSE
ncbi:autorepressor SdpR family transcription factor [Maricaulis sp.]|jgi:ArsR family transcriptional regulator, repressor of sdpIR and other operons|uniref:autorepressor SdpR family transcription factor n=1 Tax=Maricaulis sp. TaxID=1486257 RepID=UPI0025F8091C|nr:autorepressor SdpR family transcription factor [Maricaulis sp.]MDF1769139.1 autorepressor SdpR family transcription factor [Maricaulis sp.]